MIGRTIILSCSSYPSVCYSELIGDWSWHIPFESVWRKEIILQNFNLYKEEGTWDLRLLSRLTISRWSKLIEEIEVLFSVLMILAVGILRKQRREASIYKIIESPWTFDILDKDCSNFLWKFYISMRSWLMRASLLKILTNWTVSTLNTAYLLRYWLPTFPMSYSYHIEGDFIYFWAWTLCFWLGGDVCFLED